MTEPLEPEVMMAPDDEPDELFVLADDEDEPVSEEDGAAGPDDAVLDPVEPILPASVGPHTKSRLS